MAEPKTKKTTASVTKFIDAVKDEQQRKDAKVLVKMFADITGEKPAMWGTAIVGYGQYHYTYATKRTGDCALTGFSPRKGNLTLYIYPRNISPKLLKQLGSYSMTNGSCLYIKRLADVDMTILRQVIVEGYKGIKKQFKDWIV